MKKTIIIIFLCLLATAFTSSSNAQMFYPQLTKNLKTSLSQIERLYLSSLTDAGYADEIDYGMMALVGFTRNEKEELFRLPIADIASVEAMAMKDKTGAYAIKFRHKGGWEYEGFYNIYGKDKAEAIKNLILAFVRGIDLYSYENVKLYCKVFNMTYTEVDMALLPIKHYENSYKSFNAVNMVLLGLSGSNLLKDSWKDIGWKMNWVLAKHAVALQFIDDQPDFYCPSCPFIEQGNLFGYLIRHFGNGDQYRRLINRYRLNTNIVLSNPNGKPWASSTLDLINDNIELYATPGQVELYSKTKEYIMYLGGKSSRKGKNTWEENPLLIPFMGNFGKYGFKHPDGSVALKAEFEDAGHFSEGLVAVRKNRKWGFIDRTGKVVIPYQYNAAYDFHDGFAIIRKYEPKETPKYKEGYIDKHGNELAVKYDEVFKFVEKRGRVKKDGKIGFIDQSGNEVVPLEYEEATNYEDGIAWVYRDRSLLQPVIIDKNGTHLYTDYKIYPSSNNSSGLIAAEKKSNGKMGYINKKGEEVIPFIFEYAGDFSDGLACVSKGGRKYGYINVAGELVIPYKYSYANDFKNGYCQALIMTGTKTEKTGIKGDPNYGKPVTNEEYLSGLIDKTGREIIPIKYGGGMLSGGPGVLEFSEGLIAVRENSSRKWGYFDANGKMVIPFKYSEVEGFKNGIARVEIDSDSWTYIDKQGKEMFPRFISISEFNEDGYARVIEKSGKIYYINRKGTKMKF
jgi:hypothetical protein